MLSRMSLGVGLTLGRSGPSVAIAGITFFPVTVPEDSASDFAVGTATTTEASPTWSLTVDAGGFFAIDASGNVTLTATGAAGIDYEATTSYSITISDGTNTRDRTIQVGDVNEAPSFSGAPAALNYTESVAASATDFSSFLADPEFDAGNAVAPTYSIAPAVPAGFSFSSAGVLTPDTTSVVASASYTVTATDALGLTADTSFTIEVAAAVVEPFALNSYKLQIPRNASGGTTGDAHTIDQPELLTYGPNAWFGRGASFTLTVASTDPTLGSNAYPRDELRHLTDRAWDTAARTKVVATVKALPDGERVIISQALDGGGSTSGVYKIEVTGAPNSTSTGLLRLKYKGTQGATETTVVLRNDMAVDALGEMEQIAISVARYPDRLDVFFGGNVDDSTPDWSSEDSGEVPFFRDASSGTWNTKMGNYLQSSSSSPVVTSVVTLDAGTLADPTIIALDRPTGMALSNATIAENTTGLIGELTTTGGDGSLVYAVVSGPGSIVGGDKLHLAASQDFEAPTTSVDIEVSVTDGFNATYTETHTIAITDVNEAPIFSGAPPTLTYAQGDPASSTNFGSFATDVEFDAGNAVAPSFTVSPALPTGFTLNETSGILTSATSSVVALSSYVLTVTDAGGLTDTHSFTIEVTASAQVAPVGGNQSLGFTVTTDTVGPTLSVTVPADDTVDLAIDAKTHTLTFSENVYAGTGVVEIREVGGGVLESFDVETDIVSGTPSAGEIQFTGTQVIFEKSSDYANGLDVAIHVAATAVEDAAGNTFAGIANDTTLNFTTVASAGGPASYVAYRELNSGSNPYSRNFGTLTPGKYVVIVCSAGNAGVATAATIDGVAATQRGSGYTSDANAIAAFEATITDGTSVDVVATLGVPFGHCIMYLFNVDGLSFIAANGNGENSGSVNCDLTTLSGDSIIGAGVCNQNNTEPNNWTGGMADLGGTFVTDSANYDAEAGLTTNAVAGSPLSIAYGYTAFTRAAAIALVYR